jgi:hypothetical protein
MQDGSVLGIRRRFSGGDTNHSSRNGVAARGLDTGMTRQMGQRVAHAHDDIDRMFYLFSESL